MADPEDIPPSCRGSETPSTGRKGRRATRMRNLTANHGTNQRIRIKFDHNLNPTGPMADQFNSFVGTLARSKPSILIDRWKDVPQGVKDQIWESILLTFNLTDTTALKKRLIKYAGERWRAFKVDLGRYYVFNPNCGKNPLEVYPFLDQATWDRFVQSRLDHNFQEKRKKGQENQSKNVYPHVLSRGGYKRLDKKMMEEEKKALQEAASQADPTADNHPEVVDPSPPPRHRKWKRARQKSSGQYTSEEARQVAERIDALDEQVTQGTFVPRGREDILAAAIGKPDHPGCVIGVGWGVGIRQYHGSSSHQRHRDADAERERLKREIADEFRQEMAQQFSQQLAIMAAMSQQNTGVQPSVLPSVHVSTKGSCDPPHQPENDDDDDDDDDPDRCELYVDDHYGCRLVAWGRAHNLGDTIHHRLLPKDHVRVVVEIIREADARVPVPTEEVQTVGQAPGNFISWPRTLDVGNDILPKRSDPRSPEKSAPAKEIDKRDPGVVLKHLGVQVVTMEADAALVRLEHDGRPGDDLYIPKKELMEMVLDQEMASASHISLWCTYLHRISVARGNLTLYGFIDPMLIQGHVLLTSADPVSTIRDILARDDHQFYLVPYLNKFVWIFTDSVCCSFAFAGERMTSIQCNYCSVEKDCPSKMLQHVSIKHIKPTKSTILCDCGNVFKSHPPYHQHVIECPFKIKKRG